MVTNAAQPPDGLIDAVRRAADELLPARMGTTAQGAVARADVGGAAGDVDVQTPRPLYDIGLDRIADGSGLESARQVGWRTLVNVGASPVAMADSADDDDGPTVRSMNYGPFVAGLAEAADSSPRRADADTDESDRAQIDERILQVPALYFVGLWLHDEERPGDDVVVPARPAPPGLEPGTMYPAAEVLEHLALLAAEKRQIDDHSS